MIQPCDFCFFQNLKDNLRGTHFEDREELMQAISRSVQTFARDWMHHVFTAKMSRLYKCILYKGGYFLYKGGYFRKEG